MNLPPPIPESGPPQLRELQRAFNELVAYTKSLTPALSSTVRPEHTAVGVYYHAAPATAPTESSSLPTWLP